MIFFSSAVLASVTGSAVFSRGQFDSTGVSYFCFRIPALARTVNGSLIAFAEGRHLNCNDAGDVRLVRRISHDEGTTWSVIDQVKVEAGHTIGNPCPIVDLRTGHVHLLYSRDNKETFVTRSKDGGRSWGPSTNLTSSLKLQLDPTKPFVATGPPGGLQLDSGRLVGAFYYNGLNGTRSAAIFSDDHGASWKRGADVYVSATPLPNATSVVYNGGESQVARYPSGGSSGLVMLMRVRGDFPPPPSSPPPIALSVRAESHSPPNAVNHNHATAVNHNHATALSKDGGETWSPASLLHIESPYCEGSIATVGGRLFLSTPSTENGGRANLTLWSAKIEDGRVTAQYASTVYSRAAAYSSLLAGRQPGTILNLFERDNDPYVPKNLTLARVSL